MKKEQSPPPSSALFTTKDTSIIRAFFIGLQTLIMENRLDEHAMGSASKANDLSFFTILRNSVNTGDEIQFDMFKTFLQNSQDDQSYLEVAMTHVLHKHLTEHLMTPPTLPTLPEYNDIKHQTGNALIIEDILYHEPALLVFYEELLLKCYGHHTPPCFTHCPAIAEHVNQAIETLPNQSESNYGQQRYQLLTQLLAWFTKSGFDIYRDYAKSKTYRAGRYEAILLGQYWGVNVVEMHQKPHHNALGGTYSPPSLIYNTHSVGVDELPPEFTPEVIDRLIARDVMTQLKGQTRYRFKYFFNHMDINAILKAPGAKAIPILNQIKNHVLESRAQQREHGLSAEHLQLVNDGLAVLLQRKIVTKTNRTIMFNDITDQQLHDRLAEIPNRAAIAEFIYHHCNTELIVGVSYLEYAMWEPLPKAKILAIAKHVSEATVAKNTTQEKLDDTKNPADDAFDDSQYLGGQPEQKKVKLSLNQTTDSPPTYPLPEPSTLLNPNYLPRPSGVNIPPNYVPGILAHTRDRFINNVNQTQTPNNAAIAQPQTMKTQAAQCIRSLIPITNNAYVSKIRILFDTIYHEERLPDQLQLRLLLICRELPQPVQKFVSNYRTEIIQAMLRGVERLMKMNQLLHSSLQSYLNEGFTEGALNFFTPIATNILCGVTLNVEQMTLNTSLIEGYRGVELAKVMNTVEATNTTPKDLPSDEKDRFRRHRQKAMEFVLALEDYLHTLLDLEDVLSAQSKILRAEQPRQVEAQIVNEVSHFNGQTVIEL